MISNAILQLNDNGRLQELYLKWWKNNDKNCRSYDEKNLVAASHSFNNLAGVFLVVFFGLGLACFITIIENLCFFVSKFIFCLLFKNLMRLFKFI